MYDSRGAGGRGRGDGGLPDGWEFQSGKFAVLARLLTILRAETKVGRCRLTLSNPP